MKLKTLKTFRADSGVSFDILATEDLQSFYTYANQFSASCSRRPNVTVLESDVEKITEQAEVDGAVGFPESVINLDNLLELMNRAINQSLEAYDLFPTDIFRLIRYPFPVQPEIFCNPPEKIFETDEPNPKDRIKIYKFNDDFFARLDNINYLLPGSHAIFLPELVFTVVKSFTVYTGGHYYFCSLKDVRKILIDIGTPEARALLERFIKQVPMFTPYTIKQLKAAFFKLYDDCCDAYCCDECPIVEYGDGWCNALYADGSGCDEKLCREEILKWYVENSND